MAKYLYYHEDEDFCGKWYAEIEVQYDAWLPEDCVITGARVVHLECDKHNYFHDLPSREAFDRKWLAMLDRKALEMVKRHVTDDELLDAAGRVREWN